MANGVVFLTILADNFVFHNKRNNIYALLLREY